MALIRKIDCVMLRVEDLHAAREFYEQVLGLTPLWSDEHSAALGMPESEAEVVLHNDPNIARDCNVHYLVEDVTGAVAELTAAGCKVIVAPFEVRIGKCAVLVDPFGNRLNLIDMTKGPIEYNRKPKA
jgi:predicted enzyme related to lactoylglutathione lyase